ncbi:MAG: GAF domain-containing protein [Candidatus Promineifilaceae bacterium]|nr:GAF domain-containing protein [Candidatus Promineifilaceae bacterium]
MSETHTFTRPQVFAALREIVRSLSSAWDLDSTLDLIARKTTEVMHVDSCTIYLLDPEGESLRLQASTGLAKRALGRSTLRVGEGMTGYAVVHNKPIYAADAQNNPYFKWVEEAEETGLRSLLAVPLVIEDKPIGALNVQTADVHEYTADEVEVLSLIGDLAATTLARAQLYDRQRRQIGELQTLAQVSEAVTSPLYIDEVLGIVSEMAAQIMHASVCHVYLLDDSQTTLQRHTGGNNEVGSSVHIGLNQGITGRVAAANSPIYVPEIADDPDFVEKEWAQSVGLVSLLSVPLTVRDRVIGVLNCYTSEYRDFTQKERALLITLANQMALAIENAQLKTNTAMVREMHHRVKNNLQTIAMLMQLQVYETDNPDTREALETNIHRVRSIASVHEVLSEKGYHLVNVKDVIGRITSATAETMVTPGQDVTINVRGRAMSLPSRAATALALVINELVQNALEHAFSGRPVGQIDISLGRSPEEYIILVSDNGHGLPENIRPNLGLEICETLVREDLHGQIKFNRLQRGTEVSIRVPRRIDEFR